MNEPGRARCPFAGRGLDSAELRACPGFEAAPLSFDGVDVPGRYPGKAMPSGTTCRHLGFTETPRGWRSECRHPRSLPSLWVPMGSAAGPHRSA